MFIAKFMAGSMIGATRLGLKAVGQQGDEGDLAKPRPGIDPQVGDLVGVIDVDSSQNAGAARVYNVDQEQVGNR